MAPYRIDLCDRDAMRTEINKLLEAGIIEKSMSKWNFAAFIIIKLGQPRNV